MPMAGFLPHPSMRAPPPDCRRVYGHAAPRVAGIETAGPSRSRPSSHVPGNVRALVAARGDLDGPLDEVRTLGVVGDARQGLGDDRGVVGARGRVELDDPGALGDLDRLVPRDRVERTDAARGRPDEAVDLVHHPRLVAGAELGARLRRVVHAVAGVGTAVDPAL